MELIKVGQKLNISFPKEDKIVEITATISGIYDDRLVIELPQYFTFGSSSHCFKISFFVITTSFLRCASPFPYLYWQRGLPPHQNTDLLFS